MPHGTLITISQSGPRFNEEQLEPLGIFDGSRCWGVWLPDPPREDPIGEKSLEPPVGPTGRYVNEKKRDHLIVSPIHPNSWPFAFSLRIRLRHSSGSMLKAANLLAQSGINILTSECTQAGHRHAIWNIVCVQLNVKARFADAIDALDHAGKKTRGAAWEKDRDDLALRISIDMAEEMAKLRTLLLDSGEDFQYASFKDGRFFSFPLWAFTSPSPIRTGDPPSPAALKVIREAAAFSVTLSESPRLMHYWRFRARSTPPLSMTYSANEGVLVADDIEDLDYQMARRNASTPTRAIASLDSEGCHIRLVILNRREVERLIDIRLHYEATYRRALPQASRATGGLLSAITRVLEHEMERGVRVDLLRQSNEMLRLQPYRDAGRLCFLARVEHPDFAGHPEVQEETRKEIYENLSKASPIPLAVPTEPGEDPPQAYLKDIEVLPCGLAQVFISYRFDSPRREEIENRLPELAANVGLRVGLVDVATRPVTSSVIEELQRSAGFLQILTAPPTISSIANLELDWLVGEYLLAESLGLTSIRLVDVCRFPIHEWRNRVKFEGDRPLFEIRMDASVEKLEKDLQGALSKIAQVIYHREQI